MPMPLVRNKQLDQALDKVVYDSATKTLKKTVEELLRLVVKANGIPVQAGQPMIKLYGVYAEKFAELFFAVVKTEPYWKKITAMARAIYDHCQFVDKVIELSPIPKISENGIVVLLMALLDRRVASQFQREQQELRQHIRDVIKCLDCLLDTNSELDRLAARLVIDTDEFRRNIEVRNNFDLIFGTIRLGDRLSDICNGANSLLENSRRLSRHRNNWCDLIDGYPKVWVHTHNDLAEVCNHVDTK